MIENPMVIESQWRWIASPSMPVDSLKLCECLKRRAVLELNGQRFCARCAREYGFNLEEE